MRAIAGSILILAAVLFHRSPAASGPLGFGLLWLMVLMGVWYLISDLADADHPRHVVDVASRVWRRSLIGRTRFWRWLTNGHNCLIKGTVLGALVGALANLAFVGPNNIGNLAAIPGAFLGLVVGLISDSIAHRQQMKTPSLLNARENRSNSSRIEQETSRNYGRNRLNGNHLREERATGDEIASSARGMAAVPNLLPHRKQCG